MWLYVKWNNDRQYNVSMFITYDEEQYIWIWWRGYTIILIYIRHGYLLIAHKQLSYINLLMVILRSFSGSIFTSIRSLLI